MFKRSLWLWWCASLVACAPEAVRSAGSAGLGGGVSGDGGSGVVAGFGGTGAVAGFSGVGGVGGTGGSGGTPMEEPPPTPIALDECTGGSGIGASDVARLQAGGQSAGLSYLYPYADTVFPRGLIAPLLMWGGADAATAVYVHIRSSLFEYKGCLAPTGPGRVQIPQQVWEQAGTRAFGASDPFTVELTVLDGGAAKGPISEQLLIARATLKGSIYYNSYESKLGTNPGAVLRIVPGRDAELFAGGDQCTGCHAVSANGTRLVVSRGDIYAMTPMTAPQPAPARTQAQYTSFVGLSPDGQVYAVNGKPNGFGPRMDGEAPPHAMLVETDTGTPIDQSGLPEGATMTTFSGDGRHLVLNDHALSQGHGLAVMDYDPVARVASNYRELVTTTDNKYPGWPFLLPDNNAAVFALGTSTDFSGGNVGIKPIAGVPPGPWNTFLSPPKGPYSNLYVVSVSGGTPIMLARAMGYANEQDAARGQSYLLHGAEELDQNYYPTVSPVAAGGYFWVFFDSYRHYGNLGLQRQLWGAAITVSANGQYTTDPSHPAFYLTGQELGTGNHRAFTALDPCRDNGAACSTGIDCCGGFCSAGVCEMQDRCARTDEVCATSADCCDASNICINGFCGFVVPD